MFPTLLSEMDRSLSASGVSPTAAIIFLLIVRLSSKDNFASSHFPQIRAIFPTLSSTVDRVRNPPVSCTCSRATGRRCSMAIRAFSYSPLASSSLIARRPGARIPRPVMLFSDNRSHSERIACSYSDNSRRIGSSGDGTTGAGKLSCVNNAAVVSMVNDRIVQRSGAIRRTSLFSRAGKMSTSGFPRCCRNGSRCSLSRATNAIRSSCHASPSGRVRSIHTGPAASVSWG